MPRLFYCGAVIGLAALLSTSTSAQTPTPAKAHIDAPNSASKKIARVEHVVVRAGDAADGGLAIEIQTSGAPVAPDTQAITGPDRIVVDFPGALPAAELRALKINRGALKGIRTGLFFSNPPITRVVLDLAEPQSYRISTIQNAIVVKLGAIAADSPARAPSLVSVVKSGMPAATLKNASLATSPKIASASIAVAKISSAVAPAPPPPLLAPVEEEPAPPKPVVVVSYANGMLRIHAEKATLAEVLFEVQRQTQADIAIPAGAEQEAVVADLGPASAREVLAELLNGSQYNFVFVGSEENLVQVILTRRDPNNF